MSVLFHSSALPVPQAAPGAGRFAFLAELSQQQNQSGTDSDSYYGSGRLARQQRHFDEVTRREAGVTGKPGSRRHRRYLNDTFGDYESEYDTASDFDSDEDRPIVRFEWKQSFLAVGSEFYSERASLAAPVAPSVSGVKHHRRRPMMTRRERGAAPTDVEASRAEAEAYALARKARAAAKFAAASASSAEAVPSSSVAAATTDSEPSASSSQAAAAVVPRKSRRHMAGQEAAASLFLTIECSIRAALRRLALEDSVDERAFLGELENLLVAYKYGTLRDEQVCTLHFDTIPVEVAQAHLIDADLQDEDTEATSDEDLVVIEHLSDAATSSKATKKARGSNSRHRQSTGEDPLHLSFRNPRERFLAHGLVQWHQLVATSHDVPSSSVAGGHTRVTSVRLPKAGVLLHDARLLKYMHKLGKANSKAAPMM